jgi:hypothetical protein
MAPPDIAGGLLALFSFSPQHCIGTPLVTAAAASWRPVHGALLRGDFMPATPNLPTPDFTYDPDVASSSSTTMATAAPALR